MLLSPGTSLGHYTVLEPVGAGGMGEVYRARDRRLGRDVALKVLTDETSDDPDRLRRLEQEARAASSLNHPNVVVVYEIGEADVTGRAQAVRFIAMELLKGQPLSSILAEGALGTRRFLDLAVQLADGLAAAHDSGLIHRDLKPSNVIVDPEGRVKMLDFGLAKLVSPHGHETSAPTDDPLTEPGTVLGTIGYMAPEQIRGEPATAASDQFSLGCIYYEMVTGRRAFHRPSRAETLSAILKEEPSPIEELNPAVPPPIRWLIERCLTKPPRGRYSSTHDLVRDLQKLREHAGDPVLRSAPQGFRVLRRRAALPLAFAFLVVMAVSAIASLLVYRHLNPPITPEFRRLTFRQGAVSRALFVPNSNEILYSAAWDGQPLRSYLALPGSSVPDRSVETVEQIPMAFTADGTQVLALLGPLAPAINLLGQLAWRPSQGGAVKPVVSDAGWADWGNESQLMVVARNTGDERRLELRDADGGGERVLFRTTGSISSPRFSPNEKEIAFIHHPVRSDDGGEVLSVTIAGAERKTLSRHFLRCLGLDWNRRRGEIWFTAGDSTSASCLWAIGPSARSRRIQTFPEAYVLQNVSANGDRCLLTSRDERFALVVRQSGNVVRDLSWLAWTMILDVSKDGKTLLFSDYGQTTAASPGLWTRSLNGGDAVRVGEGTWARFSPDEMSLVAARASAKGVRELALIPLGGGSTKVLTSSPGDYRAPSFAGPATILFVRSLQGETSVWRIGVDGRGEKRLASTSCDLPVASPSLNVYACVGGVMHDELFVYPMDGETGRLLCRAPNRARMISVRWDDAGGRILVITRDRDFLVVDSTSGAIVRQETLAVPERGGYGAAFGAATNASATTVAYSLNRLSAGLYLAEGLQ